MAKSSIQDSGWSMIAGQGGEPPRWVVCDGAIEGLKWIGVILMTVDHINKYLFNETHPTMFALGRIAFPLFGFVLAYNLARPHRVGSVERRLCFRLTIVGLISCPIYVGLGGVSAGWWPLNIMFTLLAATGVIWGLGLESRAGLWLAALVFLAGGALGEYWWPGLTFCLASWLFVRRPSPLSYLCLTVACYTLVLVNGNSWALPSLLLIGLSSCLQLQIPRLKAFFYAYYPLHLALILMVRWYMESKGYVFII